MEGEQVAADPPGQDIVDSSSEAYIRNIVRNSFQTTTFLQKLELIETRLALLEDNVIVQEVSQKVESCVAIPEDSKASQDTVKQKLEVMESRFGEERRFRDEFCTHFTQKIYELKQRIDKELSPALASVQSMVEHAAEQAKCHADEAALRGFKRMLEKMEHRDEELRMLLRQRSDETMNTVLNQKQEDFAERWRSEVQGHLSGLARDSKSNMTEALDKVKELEVNFGDRFKQIQEEMRRLQAITDPDPDNNSEGGNRSRFRSIILREEPDPEGAELGSDALVRRLDADVQSLKKDVHGFLNLAAQTIVTEAELASIKKEVSRLSAIRENVRSSLSRFPEDSPEPAESQDSESVSSVARILGEVAELKQMNLLRSAECHEVQEFVNQKLVPNVDSLTKEVRGIPNLLETEIARERKDRREDIQKLSIQLEEKVNEIFSQSSPCSAITKSPNAGITRRFLMERDLDDSDHDTGTNKQDDLNVTARNFEHSQDGSDPSKVAQDVSALRETNSKLKKELECLQQAAANVARSESRDPPVIKRLNAQLVRPPLGAAGQSQTASTLGLPVVSRARSASGSRTPPTAVLRCQPTMQSFPLIPQIPMVVPRGTPPSPGYGRRPMASQSRSPSPAMTPPLPSRYPQVASPLQATRTFSAPGLPIYGK